MQGGAKAEAKLREALEHIDELQQKLDKLSDFFMKRSSGSHLGAGGADNRGIRARSRSSSMLSFQTKSLSHDFTDAADREEPPLDPLVNPSSGKHGEVGGQATFRDMAQLKSAHDDEISQMHAHIEELESLLESETDSNRRLREDVNMKDEYIGDLYRQNEELLEAER